MPRRVWMFPVRPVPDNDVKKPKMFVFKDMADYQANGKNVDAEYARALAANRKSGSKTATPVVQVIPKPTPKPVVEIPSEIVGKQIKHKSYGTGIITAINGANISVSFDSVGEKKLGYGICIKNKLIDFI